MSAANHGRRNPNAGMAQNTKSPLAALVSRFLEEPEKVFVLGITICLLPVILKLITAVFWYSTYLLVGFGILLAGSYFAYCTVNCDDRVLNFGEFIASLAFAAGIRLPDRAMEFLAQSAPRDRYN